MLFNSGSYTVWADYSKGDDCTFNVEMSGSRHTNLNPTMTITGEDFLVSSGSRHANFYTDWEHIAGWDWAGVTLYHTRRRIEVKATWGGVAGTTSFEVL